MGKHPSCSSAASLARQPRSLCETSVSRRCLFLPLAPRLPKVKSKGFIPPLTYLESYLLQTPPRYPQWNHIFPKNRGVSPHLPPVAPISRSANTQDLPQHYYFHGITSQFSVYPGGGV